MDLNNLKLEFVGYPNHTGGRVWIGQICIADMYQRGGDPNLFKEDPIKYEFHINPYLKIQPENEWLEAVDIYERQRKFDTIKEGLEWIKSKLYATSQQT